MRKRVSGKKEVRKRSSGEGRFLVTLHALLFFITFVALECLYKINHSKASEIFINLDNIRNEIKKKSHTSPLTSHV